MEFSGDGIIMMFYAITIIASLFQSYLVYLALTLFFDQKKPGGVRVIVGYLQFMVLTDSSEFVYKYPHCQYSSVYVLYPIYMPCYVFMVI